VDRRHLYSPVRSALTRPPFLLSRFGLDDAALALQQALADGFNFVTTDLVSSLDDTSVRNDVTQLSCRHWSTSVVGRLKTTSKAPNSKDGTTLALQWAHHMNLPAVLLPPVPSDNIHNYAANLLQKALQTTELSFQLWVPLYLSQSSLQDWAMMYKMCDGNHHIGAALTLQPLPSGPNFQPAAYIAEQLQLMHTALGMAPIRAIVLPTNMFLTNKRGYPTLSKSHQLIVEELLRRIGRTVRFLIDGEPVHNTIPSPHCGQSRALPYLQYVQHVRKRPAVTSALDTDEAKLETPHLDSLQRQLQPLKDHLEFQTYEIFEKDPVKYAKYQEALSLALQDRRSLQNCVVFVVGAGRGPLVTCALQAYKDLGAASRPKNLVVWAVEKNPSAVMYLKSMAQSHPMWKEAGVQVLCQDLRRLSRTDVQDLTCDIVVSELLGSFGDNELSPECLDAFFRTDVVGPDTLSIPMNYTALLAPVSSAELHSQAKTRALYPNEDDSGVIGMQQALETPYVVRTHAASQTHEEAQCWNFCHPATNDGGLERETILDFQPHPTGGVGYSSGYGAHSATNETVAESGPDGLKANAFVLNGLLGTFTADLYRCSRNGSEYRCQLSTAPRNFSVGMFSWFPLFFPLREALSVPMGASIRVYLWRRVGDSSEKVWYEWSVAVHRDGELLSVTPIHNPGGRSSGIGM